MNNTRRCPVRAVIISFNLVPGMYRVQVEQSGFKKATRENLEVTLSGTIRADISLQVCAARGEMNGKSRLPCPGA